MVQRIFSILIGALLGLCVFGCTRADDPKRIVLGYNEAVIAAHRTGDTGRLDDFAGEREARVVGVLVNTKRGAGLVLEATLERLEVLDSRKTGDALVIDASEQWQYYDRPLKPGSNPGRVIQAAMKVRYTCERLGRTWKVMNVMVLENTFLNRKETARKGDQASVL